MELRTFAAPGSFRPACRAIVDVPLKVIANQIETKLKINKNKSGLVYIALVPIGKTVVEGDRPLYEA